ncbi:hypothetical protein [Phenylobacterium sp. J367]|uniref:hypothetical protein n=1 Tax=Phenylobacterium sp. J367 TaxID=2898435 RepID=UPI002151880B|nr:hypothetical protein [Phenylobacterium sp. J367]MCR5881031.1 hypothetical protein [Phenylobacterium sp. J367]
MRRRASPSGQDAFVQGGVDLADAVAAGAAIDAAAERFGGLDVLLNIAGGFTWETVQAGSWGKLAGHVPAERADRHQRLPLGDPPT